jgi:hypothetical protein
MSFKGKQCIKSTTGIDALLLLAIGWKRKEKQISFSITVFNFKRLPLNDGFFLQSKA